MNDNKLALDTRLPSDKYPTKDITADQVFIEKPNGELTHVTFLPTSEMPDKTIFGNIDPLEGSPAREMAKNFADGDLLGEFGNRIKEERKFTNSQRQAEKIDLPEYE